LFSDPWRIRLLTSERSRGAAPSRPNIIFFLIDDMGYGDLSCYGNTAVSTPNLDRLAAEGIRFTQFSVSAPICSPSRTGLTTGRYPARYKIFSYLASRKENNQRGWRSGLIPRADAGPHPARGRLRHRPFRQVAHGRPAHVGDAPLITEYGFDKSLTQFEGLGDRILPLCDSCDGRPPQKYALGSDLLGRGNITWTNRSKITGFLFTKRWTSSGRRKEAASRSM